MRGNGGMRQRAWRRWLVAGLGLALGAGLGLAQPGAAAAHDFGGDVYPSENQPEAEGGEPPRCPDPSASPTGECTCAETGDDQNQRKGDPVVLSRGAEVYTRTDLAVNGVYPIRMVRRYDSRTRYDSPLGYGWAFTYDMRLFEYPDGSVIVRTGCGSRTRFVPSGGGFSGEAAVRLGLEANGDGTYTLHYRRGSAAHFDTRGRLSALEGAQGNRLEMQYDPRGKLPLTGTSPFAVDPETPMVVAYRARLTRVEERTADGNLTGRYVDLEYDEDTGRLLWVESYDGRRVTYEHDVYPRDPEPDLTRGNLVSVEGPEGVTASYLYEDPNDAHNLTSIQEGEGTTPWVNVYSAEDRVTKQTRDTRTLEFDYDLPLSATVTRTTTDAQGESPREATTEYTFDTDGYPTKIVDPLGNERRFFYDGGKNLELKEVYRNVGTIASPDLVLEQAVDMSYDTSGNRLTRSVTLDSGETVTETWTYDQNWVASYQVVSDAEPGDVFRTEYTFHRDASGAPTNVHEVKRRRADGSFQTTTLTYDANGQLETVTPPAVTPADDLVIRRSYYGSADPQPGLLESITLEVGGVADPHLARSFSYDAAGFLDVVTDARGNETDYDYDARGRLTRVENALGEATVLTYSGPNAGTSYAGGESPPPGDLLETVERGRIDAASEGQVRRLRWDARGRLASVERENDTGTWIELASYSYDSDGNRLAATDARGRTTAFAYDRLERLVSVTDAASPPNTTSFAYDARGNRTRVTDAKNRDTVFVYDDLGRLIKRRREGLSPVLVTELAYDAAGNVTAVTDPKDQTTDYAYDALSRLTAVTPPLGQTVERRYDGRGRLARVVNARGHALDYAYAPWGGLEQVLHYDSEADAEAGANLQRTVSYTYDEAGNLRSASDSELLTGAPAGSDPALEPADRLYTFAYDALDRVATTTAHYLPGSPVTQTRGYDRFGNRDALELADGGPNAPLQHGWSYNDLDRLTQASLPGGGGGTVGFGYYPDDTLETLTHASGATTDYTYHPEGPVDTITVDDPGTQQRHRLDYTLDAVLNVDAISEEWSDQATSHLFDYGYDGVDRVTSASYPGLLSLPGSESFGYDAAGNRDDAPASPSPWAYDANNRIETSPTPGGGADTTYAFDADGNVDTVTTPSGTETYTYDRTSRLRSWSDGSTTASYQYDPFGRRLRKTVDGTTTWYLWDGDRLLAEYDGSGARQARYAYAGSFAPVEVAYPDGSGGEAVYSVHTDHLDTPRMLTDASGTPVWRAVYEAYGRAHVDQDPDGDGASVAFPIRFPGQYADAETGLHYNRHRYYSPGLGRYVSSDPIGQLGSTNVFAYAGQRPLSIGDPYGLFDWGQAARGAGRAGLYIAGGAVIGAAVVATAPAWITGSAVVGAITVTAAVAGSAYVGFETGQVLTGEDIGFEDGRLTTRQMCEGERSRRAGAVAVEWATLGAGGALARASRTARSAGGATRTGIRATAHGADQKALRGVRTADELDAIRNPLQTRPVKYDHLGRPSQRMVGRRAEVVQNPDTGAIVSVNRTSSKKATRLLRQLERPR